MYRRRNQLVAPTWAGLRNWAIILFPEEQGRASKTGVFNDSITMDSHLIPFVSSISRELALGAADGQSPRSNGKQCCTTWGRRKTAQCHTKCATAAPASIWA